MMKNFSDNITQIVIIIFMVSLVYLLPTIIMFYKSSKNKVKFFIINFILGWTIIGWIYCLIKAIKEPNLTTKNKSVVETEQSISVTNDKTNTNKEDADSHTENNKVIKISFTNFVIGIISIVILGVMILALVFNSGKMSNKELTDIIKQTEYGYYLQQNSVKLGTTSNINYNNYNKLITYSNIIQNNSVQVKAGGILLYNTKTKSSKVINVSTDLTSIIYYLNSNGMNSMLNTATNIIRDYIEQYGTEVLFDNKESSTKYKEMVNKVGEKVGVNLCRNIIKENMIELSPNLSNTVFLYSPNEISLKYMGMNVTVQEYNWAHIIDETGARLMATNNYRAYRNLVAIYGEPYTNVTKFVVYEYINGNAKEVKKYDSLQKAKKDLNVQE